MGDYNIQKGVCWIGFSSSKKTINNLHHFIYKQFKAWRSYSRKT